MTYVLVKLYSDKPSQAVPSISNRYSRLVSRRHSPSTVSELADVVPTSSPLTAGYPTVTVVPSPPNLNVALLPGWQPRAL